jgi:hypothetical protein
LVISKYLPRPEQIYPVYGLVVFCVYGWSIYWFAWNLPSWLSFIPLGQIIGVLSYALTVNLIESLVVLAVLILLSAVLPAKWFRADFVFRAGLTAISFSILGMYLLGNFVPLVELTKDLLIFAVIFIALQYLLGRISLARRVIESFADRSTVFLYISIPVTLLGVINIALRNFWNMH